MLFFAWPVPTMSRRCRSRPKSKPRSLPQRLPLPVANLQAELAGAGSLGQTRSVRLRYTLPALADLSAILDYIAAHSPQRARRVQARIKALTDLLLVHPHWPPHEQSGYPPDDHGALRLSGFLRGDADRDHHPAVRHAARDPSDMPGSA